jgi:tetratricopeptide (TPR) repeat protein
MEEITVSSLIDTVTACSSEDDNRYCFVLGSGASRASGIRTGAEMAKDWLEDMKKDDPKGTRKWVKKNKIDNSDLGSFYSDIFARRFRSDYNIGYKILQDEMEKAIPSPGYYYLSDIINYTHNKFVITTNFDSLTEDSLLNYRDKKALVITHERLAEYIEIVPNRPTVVKLHRDIFLQPIIMNTNIDALHSEWKNNLSRILGIYTPIFIGYSGNDADLMNFLNEISTKNKKIYWCFKKGNPVNKRTKDLLERYHSYVIPIDDFDYTMQLLGKQFNSHFSIEFIQKSENERTEKRVNKINECMKNIQKLINIKEPRSNTEIITNDSLNALSKLNIPNFEEQDTNEEKNTLDYIETGKNYFNFQKDYNKAIQYFTKAIELELSDAAYYYRGISYYELKEYAKAIEDLTKAIKLKLNDAEYYFSRGISYRGFKDYKKAIEDLTKAIELEPNDALFYFSRNISYYEFKEYAKAIEDITKAIELKPNYADYYYSRGISYYELKEYEKSIEDLTKAIELEPNDALFYYNRGISYRRLRDYKKAIEDISNAINIEPNDAVFYFSRSTSYRRIKDYNKAIKDLTKAIELEHNESVYYYSRGKCYNELKENKKAIEDLTKAIVLEPNDAEYYYSRSYSYYELNEFEKAINDLTKAIELESNYAEYYYSRGISYYVLKEYKRSIEDLTKAIELNTNNAEYYHIRGISYFWLNKYEKAIADISKAIELEPDDAYNYLYLARVLCKINDFKKALINLSKAMHLNRKLPFCYNVRGFIGLKKAKQNKTKCKAYVLENLSRAIELNNDDSFTSLFYKDRVEYYLYSNEPDKAYEDLQKAISLDNKDGHSYFLLARYYEIKGNTQEYERCMAKAKELRYIPDSSD